MCNQNLLVRLIVFCAYSRIAAAITSQVCGSHSFHVEASKGHHNTTLTDKQPEFQGAVPFAMPVQKLLSKEWSERKESVGPQELEIVEVGGTQYNVMVGESSQVCLLIYIGVAPSKTSRGKYPRCKLCAHTHSYILRPNSNMQHQYCF
jgi:hypothetical protein